jgi:hypothetical protein
VPTLKEAARAAIEAEWPQGRVHAPNAVPNEPITPYVVMYGDAGRDAVRMNDGTAGAYANRLAPMAVGTTEDELSRAVAAIKRGLRGRSLVFDGHETTPLELESSGSDTRDPDGGSLLSQTLTFTSTAFPIPVIEETA